MLRLPALRGGEARAGLTDFEDLLELADPPLRRADGRRGDVPRALPLLHGRRVPGRQPAPADAARTLARRPATSSARSATTTRRSTASRAPAPRTCSRCPSASRARRSSGWSRTTARRRRCSRSRTGSRPQLRHRKARRGRRPEPVLRPLVSSRSRRRSSSSDPRRRCPLEEIAILAARTRASADFEQALHEAGVPFQGASLLAREAARFLLRRCARTRPGGRAGAQARARSRAGSRRRRRVSASASRCARTISTRLVRLAESLAPASVGRVPSELERRFGASGAERAACTCSRSTLPRGSSSSRLPAAPRGARAAGAAGEDGRADRRGAAAPVRRDHAREARARRSPG